MRNLATPCMKIYVESNISTAAMQNLLLINRNKVTMAI